MKTINQKNFTIINNKRCPFKGCNRLVRLHPRCGGGSNLGCGILLHKKNKKFESYGHQHTLESNKKPGFCKDCE